MKYVWICIGRALFVLTWPGVWVYLRRTKRTRVFIRCGDELLAIKGWLGNGMWAYPGGGLHRNEDPATGAIREVYEETGLMLVPEQLQYLFEIPRIKHQKVGYHCIVYGVELPQKIYPKPPRGEIVAAEWRPIQELLELPDDDRLLSRGLDIWNKPKKT